MVGCVVASHLTADMALYDVPANIDYVSSVTHRNVSYIGHSQGTTQAFAGFTANPHIANKLNSYSALAPVAWVGNARSVVFKALAELHFEDILNKFGIHEFWIPDDIHVLLPGFCQSSPS